MANKDVAKDIRSAIQLEQELQISYAQRGVSVLDVYSAEWGNCKAIAETFRRLATDSGDAVHLRFFTVECNAVLASLKNDDQRNPQRPKNVEAIRDTLPEGWQSILQDRCGQSKPYFVFFKEGKKAGFVEGVNTPLIRAKVKELCTVKTPASDFITNSKLLEFWEECFNADESEVPPEKFFKGLLSSFKATVPLNDAEKTVLFDALGVKKEAKEKIITAEGLQKWIGDDETRSIQQIFNEALPDYEDRAAKVVAEEKKQAAEDEARKKKEEEEARVEKERKAKEAEEEAQRKAKEAAEAKAKNPQDGINELLPKFPEFSSESEAVEGDSIKFRHAAESRNIIFAGPPRLALTTTEDADAKAAADADKIRNAKSLVGELAATYKLSLPDVKALVSGIQAKNAGSQLTGFANLSRALLAADEDDVEALLGSRANPVAALSSGNALDSFTSFAAQAVTTAAESNSADLYFSGASVSGLESAKDGDQVALQPLSVLTSQPADGSAVTVKLVGVPNVLRISDYVLNIWYSVFSVDVKEGGNFVLTFQRLLQEDDFVSAATSFSTQANADEKRFADLQKLQALLAEKGTAKTAKSPEPVSEVTEKAPEAPASEKEKTPERERTPEKPKTPEEKPKTPEEKPKTPEEKPKTPEEKPKTPDNEPGEKAEEEKAEDAAAPEKAEEEAAPEKAEEEAAPEKADE